MSPGCDAWQKLPLKERFAGAKASFRGKGTGDGADGVGLAEGASDHDGIAKGVAPDTAAQDGLGIDSDDVTVRLLLDAYALVGEYCEGHAGLASFLKGHRWEGTLRMCIGWRMVG